MAKILINSKEGAGAWFSLRLIEEGHSVDYYLKNQKFACVLGDICPEPMDKIPDFSKYDLSLFDCTGMPKLAEQSVLQTPTIGDGNLQSELEDNRLLGIEVMEQVGINVPFYEHFNDLSDAKRFIRKTNKRYVFKPFSTSGTEQDTATTYVAKSAEDMLRYLDRLSINAKGAEFLLQEVVQGTEISTEAWFNGEEFFLVNSTLEEKKLMNDGKGPNTGCAGNLVWTYRAGTGNPYIFVEGLAKMKDFLKQYNYHGMIDLNTIVSEDHLYGLEWTPRFGYDATATLFALIASNLGDFLGAIASGSRPEYEIRGLFASAIRLSIPPYPTEIQGKHPEDIPIEGIEEDDCIKNCYLYDACLDRSGDLVTCGVSGLVAVPICTGETIEQSFSRCYSKVEKINIPDMQYRTDLKESTCKRYSILDREGWLS
jgi:phosphoribosylamine--glycine ligase